jgi:hypothetical protein
MSIMLDAHCTKYDSIDDDSNQIKFCCALHTTQGAFSGESVLSTVMKESRYCDSHSNSRHCCWMRLLLPLLVLLALLVVGTLDRSTETAQC